MTKEKAPGKPNNEEIKALLKAEKIPYWRLATALLCHESTVIRTLRTPLTPEKYALYIEAINIVKGQLGRA